MRIADVIGTVTLSRCHPSFSGATLKIVHTLNLEQLANNEPADPATDAIVMWDELGAGLGSRIALSEGPEASQPFRPDIKPVDAYNAAILDDLDLQLPRTES